MEVGGWDGVGVESAFNGASAVRDVIIDEGRLSDYFQHNTADLGIAPIFQGCIEELLYVPPSRSRRQINLHL